MTDKTEVVENTVYLDDTQVVIGKKRYELVTHGRQQAIQMAGITRWASRYGADIYTSLQNQGSKQQAEGGIQFLLDILGMLDADAMIGLFQAFTGCSVEEAELYFDAAVLIEAGIVVYEKHPTVRNLLNRFFSTSDSEAEDQPESSTTSE